MSVEARSAVLNCIQKALKDRAPADPCSIAAEWDALPRHYEQVSRLSPDAVVDLFEDRLHDYGAEVTRVVDAQVAMTIATALAARGNRPTLLPEGFPAHWVPSDAPLIVDECFSARQLDGYEGVVTGASVAIADTGTLILQNLPGQGRRAATLVPDFHLCVVRVEDIVQTVPEAFAVIAPRSALPTTFVSGPSATADIEMTRIKGVHGPRFLHVLLVTR